MPIEILAFLLAHFLSNVFYRRKGTLRWVFSCEIHVEQLLLILSPPSAEHTNLFVWGNHFQNSWHLTATKWKNSRPAHFKQTSKFSLSTGMSSSPYATFVFFLYHFEFVKLFCGHAVYTPRAVTLRSPVLCPHIY